jgi:oligopeptide/dipeptide ABC transporter ATP-binding protein
VVFDGLDVFGLKRGEMRSLRRRMQIVFQDPYGSLNPRMTVGAMLQEPLLVHGIDSGGGASEPPSGSLDKRRVDDRVHDLLSLVGLGPEAASRYPHEFSGGQRQRIGIARALTVNPEFIVCDEAVSALDVSIQAQILNLLLDLQRRFSLTYLFIAHDLSVVRHLADRVAVMYLGEIVEEADTEELFARPLHPYTQALLESIPLPKPHSARSRPRVEGEVASSINPPSGCRFRTRCPIAIEDCATERPPLTEIRPGHKVACIRTEVSIVEDSA